MSGENLIMNPFDLLAWLFHTVVEEEEREKEEEEQKQLAENLNDIQVLPY